MSGKKNNLDDFFQEWQKIAAEWKEVRKAYGMDITEKANRVEMLDEAVKDVY